MLSCDATAILTEDPGAGCHQVFIARVKWHGLLAPILHACPSWRACMHVWPCGHAGKALSRDDVYESLRRFYPHLSMDDVSKLVGPSGVK